MTGTELTHLQRTIAELRQCVGSLKAQYGDSTEVRRLANDVDRLGIDAEDIAQLPTPRSPRLPLGGKPEKVVVPDTPYDPALWLGADDEGVGGIHPHRQ
ncbi:MAG TPA: hypothetical protein VG756_25265 [Pseudonocardiaceae bacterium]|nr:hypothetical protein [Pseudonocardiaceae bacterium]